MASGIVCQMGSCAIVGREKRCEEEEENDENLDIGDHSREQPYSRLEASPPVFTRVLRHLIPPQSDGCGESIALQPSSFGSKPWQIARDSSRKDQHLGKTVDQGWESCTYEAKEECRLG